MTIRDGTQSLADFQLHTPEFVRQLKETGQPVILTIDGKAELVVQDAASYQRLIDRARQSDDSTITRKAVAEMEAGLGRSADEMLAEMRLLLAEKQSRIPDPRATG